MVIFLVALLGIAATALAWAARNGTIRRATRRAEQAEAAGSALTVELETVRAELGAARADAAELRVSAARSEGQAAALEDAERRLTERFATVSREALDRNSHSFLELAGTRLAQQQAEAKGDLDQRRIAVEQLIAPLNEALERVETGMAGIEQARQNAYAGLTAQVKGLTETHERLRTETASLVGALRSPQTRGRWGEVQLRRVVEMAGMVPHCDFVEQMTVERAGVIRRPDVIIKLPGHRRLAVDAKVPLSAYLEAHETADDDRKALLLRDHARALRAHVNSLADKAYWEQFPEAPDFVVLFIPGEPFLAAAFEHEPELFEYAHGRRVLLATPTTLIALLQSVAVGWREASVAEDARAVCEVGRELYRRLATMGEHVAGLGRALDKAVDAYNRQVGSLESRVLVTARKLASLELGESELAVLEPVERAARLPQAEELTRLAGMSDDNVA
ncbi:MAG: DNA recombination protein RmuC [Acidimicrobiales bacterium]